MEEKRIIEINGVKLEVDMRYAVQVDKYRVGDKVKVLIKTYSDYKSHFGVICGFDNFVERPTLIVVYLDSSYSGADLKWAYIHKDSKDIELAPARDFDLTWEQGEVVNRMDKEVLKLQEQIADIQRKKTYFLEHFAKHFDEVKAAP